MTKRAAFAVAIVGGLVASGVAGTITITTHTTTQNDKLYAYIYETEASGYPPVITENIIEGG